MTSLRPMAVAGQFYPNDAAQLQQWFSQWIQPLTVEEREQPIPRALIVPHAGYVYSGQAAAKGFQLWQNAADKIKTVVIIGPAHRVAFDGITTVTVDEMETPLGNLAVDGGLRLGLMQATEVVHLSDFAQQQEHSIEVMLPFIKHLLPDVKVLPLLNGKVEGHTVAAVLHALWQKEGVYFVISSDLSHFHPDAEARQIDGLTAEKINQFDWQDLDGEAACGYKGIQGVLALKSVESIRIQQLELINSGGTAGDKNRVVGYGTWALYEEAL